MSRTMYLYSVKIIIALLMGLFMSVAAGTVITAHAAEVQTVEVIEDENTALADSGEANGGGMFLLMGGFVVIILAVVIAVVATFVSTAAISDEL